MPDSCFLLTCPLPESLADKLGALPGVERVDKIAFVPADVNGQPALVLARSFAQDRPPSLDLRRAPTDVQRGLLRGEAVVGGALALRLGVDVGDSVQLQRAQGPVALRVAGIVTEYAADGNALYLEWHKAVSLLRVPGVDAFLVTARPESRKAFVSPLQDFCAGNTCCSSRTKTCAASSTAYCAVSGSLWVLVALIFAVASLGVVNTLAMNVLEQVHELAVLRSLGMTRGQVRRVVQFQALLIGLASMAPGAAAGIGLAALLNRATNVAFGRQVVFAVHLPLTCGCFAAGMVITAIAARARPHRRPIPLFPHRAGRRAPSVAAALRQVRLQCQG